MMQLQAMSLLGRQEISTEHPAGNDPRHTPEHDALLAEIAKLTSVQGSEDFSWQAVAQAACAVLEKGKDFQAAAYLAVALSHTDGLSGTLAGANLLADFFEHFWESGFPPLKRLRGRQNALDWWHERTKDFLATIVTPSSSELHKQLQEAVIRLDAVSSANFPDGTPLFDLRDAIDRLPLAEEPSPPPPAPQSAQPAAPVTGAPQSEALENNTGAAQNASQAAPVAPAAPVQATGRPESAPDAPGAPGPAAQQPGQKTPQAAGPAPVQHASDGEAVQAARTQFFQSARNYYDAAFAGELPTDPVAWQALCLCLWGKMAILPPSSGGTTGIAAPDEQRLAAIRALAGSGRAADAARAAVLMAPEKPFALDLFRIIEQGLAAGGNEFSAAQSALRHGIEHLVERFPGLTALKFSDGTPFADEAVASWLSSLRGDSTGGTADEISRLIRTARETAGRDGLAAALAVLQSALFASSAARSRLRLRVASLQLLLAHNEPDAAVLQADVIEETLSAQALEGWEPALAREALETALAAWKARLSACTATAPDAGTSSPRAECTAAIQRLLHRLARLRLGAGAGDTKPA